MRYLWQYGDCIRKNGRGTERLGGNFTNTLSKFIYANGYGILSSVDGTLRREGESIPEEVVKCMKFIDERVGFGLVTGGDVGDVEGKMEGLGDYKFGVSANHGAFLRFSDEREIKGAFNDHTLDHTVDGLLFLARDLNRRHGIVNDDDKGFVETRSDSGLPNFVYNKLWQWKEEVDSAIGDLLQKMDAFVIYPGDKSCEIVDKRYTKEAEEKSCG
ncbi:haloacid dehydrogenase [Gracilaria domingensis]|nr:haloacid dehydrogenase [Gracilaria domingensis]